MQTSGLIFDPDLLEQSAWTAHHQRDFRLAAQRWAELRERCPERIAGYFRGGIAHRELGEREAADALIRAAMLRAPDHFEIAAAYAWLSVGQEDWAAALARWTMVRERFPGEPLGYARAGQALIALERLEEADALLAAAAERFPLDAGIAMERARIAKLRRDWPAAIRHWSLARAQNPNDAGTHNGLGRALMDAGRLAEAEAVFREAVAQFPGKEFLAYNYAENATRRGCWVEALERWRIARERFPENVSILQRAGAALWLARLDGFEAEISLHGDSFMHDMLMQFESMGDNCEFGVFQRKFGAEPLGLLRWTGISCEMLIKALGTRFAGVGEAGETELEIVDGNYEVHVRRYHMRMHSFIPENEAERAKIHAQQASRMRYLRRKFLEDIAGGEKIFVFKSSAGLSLEQADRLNSAMKRHGPNTLLCIMRSDETHPNGFVKLRAPGLMIGYMDRISPRVVDSEIDFTAWETVSRNAFRIWHEPGAARDPETYEPPEADAGFHMSETTTDEMAGDEETLEAALAAARAESDPAASLAVWRRIAERFDDNPVGPVELAVALSRLERWDEAEEVLAKAAADFSDDGWVAEQRAWLATNRRDFALAAQRWEELRANFSDRIDGYHRGGMALRELGRLDEADELLLEAVGREPENIWILADLAWVSIQRDDWAQALDRFTLMRERFADDPMGYARSAEALRVLGRMDEAEALLTQALAMFPEDPEVLMEWGRVAHDRRDFATAAERWVRVRKKFPDDAGVHGSLGLALMEIGRLEEADRVLCEAVARFPDSDFVVFNHAEVATRREDWQASMERWRAARQRFPDNRGMVYRAGAALWKARLEGIETDIPLQDDRAMYDLCMWFESLGDNCEFGVFQRKFGAEPLSLLRWSSLSPESLADALLKQFEGLGNPEETELVVRGNEYEVLIPRYKMEMHTFITATEIDASRLHTLQTRRMRYLRGKFLEDVKRNDKIFVYKASRGMTLAQADMLNQAMKSLGENTLLCMLLADEAHPNGTVEMRSEGFMIGYMDRFSARALDTEIDFDSWGELARNAYMLWDRREEE